MTLKRGDRAKLAPFRPFHHFEWDGRLRSKTVGHYIRDMKKDRERRITLNIARLKLRCSDYPNTPQT